MPDVPDVSHPFDDSQAVEKRQEIGAAGAVNPGWNGHS
jgi:hypothetical protein